MHIQSSDSVWSVAHTLSMHEFGVVVLDNTDAYVARMGRFRIEEIHASTHRSVAVSAHILMLVTPWK